MNKLTRVTKEAYTIQKGKTEFVVSWSKANPTLKVRLLNQMERKNHAMH